MSGLETGAVVLSAIALLIALMVALQWRRSRRELRDLRHAVEGLSDRRTWVAAGRPPRAPEPAWAEPVVPEPRLSDIAVPLPAPRADAIVTAEGRTIVVPTTAQVVDATMGRPLVRASALAHGLRRALRPQSRDRIRALMRREFQRRRKMRQRAARRAARMAPVHQSEEGTSR
jgi:hypothetical protein